MMVIHRAAGAYCCSDDGGGGDDGGTKKMCKGYVRGDSVDGGRGGDEVVTVYSVNGDGGYTDTWVYLGC